MGLNPTFQKQILSGYKKHMFNLVENIIQSLNLF